MFYNETFLARYSAHSFASFGIAACTEDKPESRSSAAEILTFTFDTENPANSAISGNPTIGQAQAGHASINIALNGHYHDTTLRALVPTITISENATVSPASGVARMLHSGSPL